MAQLQKPAYVYMGGKLCAWDEAVLHIGCEAVTRGLNVFEGIKGYWQPNSQFAIVMLRAHYNRLYRSARMLDIPCPWSFEDYRSAIWKLIDVLVSPDQDMWARTTLYVTDGHWGEGTVADLVVTAYHVSKKHPEPINLGLSTWQRSSDVSLPARIKTSTNYQVGRLARIEGRPRGCDDMVLLNQSGRIAEATGACVLMVRDGIVYTPPPTEGALESITIDALEALAASLGIAFVRRPIDRSELLVADELGLAGTLAELTLADRFEGKVLPGRNHILGRLQSRYLSAVRGVDPFPAIDLAAVACPRTA